jgi:hypothetical protein
MEKVNKTAVENFIGSLDRSFPIEIHIYNLMLDQRLYKWNDETYSEIKKNIFKIYKIKI